MGHGETVPLRMLHCFQPSRRLGLKQAISERFNRFPFVSASFTALLAGPVSSALEGVAEIIPVRAVASAVYRHEGGGFRVEIF